MDHSSHTPAIAFRHLPLNSARFSYATKGALFISAQLSTDAVSALRKVWVLIKLQALVYDLLPSTTAVFSYAIRSWKLSANDQFCCCAQTEVILLQTAQIISHVCFITGHVAYASSNETEIVWIETELFFIFFYPGWIRLLFTCVLWRWVASTAILVPEPFGGRWPHRWTAARR